nr:zinc finger, CCHC-type [Tanacetum cinerariifolium]
MVGQAINNSVFRYFFEKEKLTRPNFIDWYRNMRIVLTVEDKLTYLEHLIPIALVPAPRQQLPQDVLAAHTRCVKTSKEIACLMLVNITPELQMNLEHFAAYDML